MKALFVCNQNKHRSKTAEELFRNKFKTKSSGLFNADPLKKDELKWADIIFVMEEHQRTEIGKRFPEEYLKKRILNLEIPDNFSYNQPELIKILNEKIKKLKIEKLF